MDLSHVTVIGNYAFYHIPTLQSVTFRPATVGEGAFLNCEVLSNIQNEESLESIGDRAFAYTAITEADLTGVTHIGAHAFQKESLTPFVVTLGTNLTSLGDNPFAMCQVAPFCQEIVTDFNGSSYITNSYTFNLTESVKVVDGSLYLVVPSGLELITFAGSEDVAKIADGTVRISALAFAGNDVTSVILPYTVKSVGHKAFFGCDNLKMVTFTSYDAPTLEEEYDYDYFLSNDNIAGSGEYTF
jgi:hypothetical protein